VVTKEEEIIDRFARRKKVEVAEKKRKKGKNPGLSPLIGGQWGQADATVQRI